MLHQASGQDISPNITHPSSLKQFLAQGECRIRPRKGGRSWGVVVWVRNFDKQLLKPSANRGTGNARQHIFQSNGSAETRDEKRSTPTPTRVRVPETNSSTRGIRAKLMLFRLEPNKAEPVQVAVAGRLGRFRMSHWFLCFQPPPPTPAAGPISVWQYKRGPRPECCWRGGRVYAPAVPRFRLSIFTKL